MDLADQLGIMIINECPAVGLIHLGLGGELLDNHKQSLTEMYNRDKNRPSVIMWSAGNEPASSDKQATDDHFREVFEHIHSLDNTRPVTVINFNGLHDNQGGEYIDIIGFNFYTGWYQDTGELDVVVNNLLAEGQRLRTQFNKPVMITEYGSDTQEGLHILPSFVWAEEYQTEIISHFFQAFDQMRNEGYFIGEMIWCFADFKTDQSVNRVGGNKKGIFTRNREPKASAHLLRKRYWALAELLDDVEAPADSSFLSQISSTSFDKDLYRTLSYATPVYYSPHIHSTCRWSGNYDAHSKSTVGNYDLTPCLRPSKVEEEGPREPRLSSSLMADKRAYNFRCTVVPTVAVAELWIDSSPDRWDAVPTSPRKRLHNPAPKGRSSSPVFLWDKEKLGRRRQGPEPEEVLPEWSGWVFRGSQCL
ncbi:hypothetical protein GEV33_006610 [Tenebrio molitor]|uniref:Glycoside hydrolase family 2 catalytic domain-containing protein n=1 Tax=Tenebrio molitor TaxID=7067 RepID=A0A8J6HJN2_TENMO|nr:hypothetical protein GEV33_006610 [Tenebrio molitor]